MRKWYDKGHGSSLYLVGGQVYLYVDKIDARRKDAEFIGRCAVNLKIGKSSDEAAVRAETIRQTRKIFLAALAELDRQEREK
jgi:hypothetical protein